MSASFSSDEKNASSVNAFLLPSLDSENLASNGLLLFSKIGSISGNVTINVQNYKGPSADDEGERPVLREKNGL